MLNVKFYIGIRNVLRWSVVKLSVAFYIDVRNVFRLSVIMVSVVAPKNLLELEMKKQQKKLEQIAKTNIVETDTHTTAPRQSAERHSA
jgi:hypothetical protein